MLLATFVLISQAPMLSTAKNVQATSFIKTPHVSLAIELPYKQPALIVQNISGGVIPAHVYIVSKRLIKHNVRSAKVQTTYLSQIPIPVPLAIAFNGTSVISSVLFTIMTGTFISV